MWTPRTFHLSTDVDPPGRDLLVDLEPTRGRDQQGRRPSFVISRDDLNDLPLTLLVIAGSGAEHFDPNDRFPTDLWVTAAESGLPKDTVFMGIQIRSVDHSRLGSYIGRLPDERIEEVWELVRFVLKDTRPLQ